MKTKNFPLPMKQATKLLPALILVISLVLFPKSSFSSQSPTPLEEGYEELARLQQAACQIGEQQACNYTIQKCMDLVQTTLEEMPKASRKLFDAPDLSNSVCTLPATKYEFPGTHALLQSRLGDVYAAANELGIVLPKDIVYGALPLRGVDAEVQVKSKYDVPIIMVNLDFMTFANELSKLAAQTIPTDTTGDQIGLSTDDKTTVENILMNPLLIEQLIEYIQYYQGKSISGNVPPNNISATVQMVYTKAIEDFAVAHEVGHVYYGHLSSSFDFPGVRGVDLHPGMTTLSELPLPIREIEADGFAARILLQIRDDELKTGDNSFFSMLLSGAQFYFISQEIMDDAQASSLTLRSSQNYTKAMQDEVKPVAECVVRSACDVSNIPGLLQAFPDHDIYPPHMFRQAVLAEVATEHPLPPKYDQFQVVADAVNHDIIILWAFAQPELLASAQSNADHALKLFSCAGRFRVMSLAAQMGHDDDQATVLNGMMTASSERAIGILLRLGHSQQDVLSLGQASLAAGANSEMNLLKTGTASDSRLEDCTRLLIQ